MNHCPGRACGTQSPRASATCAERPQVRSVLIRTGAFSVGATSLLALLPVICQPHGAQGYGFLLTCFGLGALAGAALLPRLRLRYSVDGLVAGATLVFAAMTFMAGQSPYF